MDTPRPPDSGLESIPEGESDAIGAVRDMVAQTLRKRFESGERPARRDAHAKHHGCVKAEFRVMDQSQLADDQQLPPSLRVGVFARPAVYPAWIRFSNGAGKIQNDSVGDARGLAIKLMNVPGDKILTEEKNASTQDFLLINHPAFIVRDAEEYVEFFQRLKEGGSPFRFFFPILRWPPVRWHEFQIARALTGKTVSDMLGIRYWSMTPYAAGSRAVKYSAIPCAGEMRQSLPDNAPSDHLRDAMTRDLSAGSACFDFMLQPQMDAQAMPIEDSTIEWDEKLSAFKKAARITIPPQNFDSEAQMKFCEDLSFTPWHSLPEHKPLGGINRTRLEVYREISRLRHQLNKKIPAEPSADSVKP